MDDLRHLLANPEALLAHLPASLRSYASYLPLLSRWALNYLLAPVLSHLQALGHQLTRLVRASPSELGMQDIAMPLLSLVLLYVAVTSALRTARAAVGFGFWIIKWGAIVGVIAVAWAYVNGDGDAGGRQAQGWGKGTGRGTAPTPPAASLLDQAWRLINGQHQRDLHAGNPGHDAAWADWIPGWIKGDARGDYWLEVVDGLGAQNVRRAAEEWWNEQVNHKARPKGKGAGKKDAKASAKKRKADKSSRVR